MFSQVRVTYCQTFINKHATFVCKWDSIFPVLCITCGTGLYGENNEEAAIIDEILGNTDDMFRKFVTIIFEKDDERKVKFCKTIKYYSAKFGLNGGNGMKWVIKF